MYHLNIFNIGRYIPIVQVSPDLVAMGRDSCPEGFRFESQHHFLYIFVVKIVKFEKTKNKRKSVRGWPIFINKTKLRSKYGVTLVWVN